MAVLNIRNLPDEVHTQLRIRAARANRSMEAEARAILAALCKAPATVDGVSLQAWVHELYCGRTPTNVVEDLIAERRREAECE